MWRMFEVLYLVCLCLQRLCMSMTKAGFVTIFQGVVQDSRVQLRKAKLIAGVLRYFVFKKCSESLEMVKWSPGFNVLEKSKDDQSLVRDEFTSQGMAVLHL